MSKPSPFRSSSMAAVARRLFIDVLRAAAPKTLDSLRYGSASGASPLAQAGDELPGSRPATSPVGTAAHLPYAPVRIRIPRVIPTKTGWDIWGPRFDNKPRHPLGHHGSVGPSHSTIWSRLTTRGRFEYSRFGGSSLAGASDAIRVPYASIVDISPVGMDALIGVEAGKSHSTTACLWHKEVTARTMRSVSNWVRRF
mgnify:CR=1 FL=1